MSFYVLIPLQDAGLEAMQHTKHKKNTKKSAKTFVFFFFSFPLLGPKGVQFAFHLADLRKVNQKVNYC